MVSVLKVQTVSGEKPVIFGETAFTTASLADLQDAMSDAKRTRSRYRFISSIGFLEIRSIFGDWIHRITLDAPESYRRPTRLGLGFRGLYGIDRIWGDRGVGPEAPTYANAVTCA